jgi:hypothetical protein
MSGKFIRTLYGDIQTVYLKLKKEVSESLKDNEWAQNEIIHYAMGDWNYDFLKKHGAKHVVLVDHRPCIQPAGYTHFWNKTYMINYAMEVDGFEEIVFIDFDNTQKKPIDDRFWELLRAKKGRFNGSFQVPSVGYKKPICLEKRWGGFRIKGKHSLRKALNTSFVYCNDKSWMKEYLDEYERYYVIRGNTHNGANDEHILIYYLDRVFDVPHINDIITDFEPDVCYLCRGLAGLIDVSNNGVLWRIDKCDWPNAGRMIPSPKIYKDLYFCHA